MEWDWEINYPEKYNSGKIKMHPKCKEDLEKLLEESGYTQEFIRIFRLRLRFLEDKWKECRLKGNWFEILKGTNEIYSMKFNGEGSKKNLRIILIFKNDKNTEVAFLLHAFQEKDNKNTSKTSYKSAIDIAIIRASDC